MNNLKWLFRIAIRLFIVCIFSWQTYKLFYWLSSAKPLAQKQGDETRSTVHWLESNRPLTYTFSPSQAIEIRILSNAILNAEQPADSSAHYAIQYELWDDNQQLITRERYHHAARFIAQKDQPTKQIMENKETLHVSSGQSFYLRRHVFNNAKKLVLNLIPEDAFIKGVVVRVHAKTKTNEQDAQRTWQKYPVLWRDRISQYHTLGPYALSDSEIANAVQYDWQKLAPLGIPEVDFVQGVLYESLPYHVASYDFSSEQLNTDAFLSSNTLTASVNVYQQQDLYFSSETSPDALKLTWYDPKKFAPPKTLRAESTDVANQYKLNDVNPVLSLLSQQLMFCHLGSTKIFSS